MPRGPYCVGYHLVVSLTATTGETPLSRAYAQLEKLRSLAPLLLSRPREFGDLALGYLDLHLGRLLAAPPERETVTWEAALRDLQAALGARPGPSPNRASDFLAEPALGEVEEGTRRLLEEIVHEDVFRRTWAADSLLARLCYLSCRLLEPAVVVETGVAYGVSSAFILKALGENGRGRLHSVDVPPFRRGYEKFWGVAVPEALRRRWTLHRGPSAKVLPRLLEETGEVDLFVHDSLHTRRNMRREFGEIWPRLLAGGVILADDVDRNDAFDELRPKRPALWRVIRDRERHPLHGPAAPVTIGMAVK